MSRDLVVEPLVNPTPAEAGQVRALLAQLSPRGTKLTPTRLQHVLDSGRVLVMVARLEGKIIATASLITMPRLSVDYGMISEVVVDNAYRGRGIGAKVVAPLIDDAHRRGLAYIDLTSRPEREAAHTLYSSFGFKPRDSQIYRLDLGYKH